MSAPKRTLTPLEPVLDAVEGAAFLDEPGKNVGAKVRGKLAPGAVKDAVSGTWIGHAIHPLLTDVVIGSFVSATLLDLLGGDDDGRSSERLIAVGIAAYGPTALTGVSDYADSELSSAAVRRVGVVHAAGNATALGLYTASLVARRRGRRNTGRLLGLAGATALSAAGFLGGHLSFTRGVGPDQTAFDPGPGEWSVAADSLDVITGAGPTAVVVGDTPVLLLRDAAGLHAIHDRCSHRGCSLSGGEVRGDEIVCPCHGSRFALADGALRAGPATAPQPAFETREREGRIELRLFA